MSSFSQVENHVSQVTGLSVFEIRNYSPEQIRLHLEKKTGKKVSFISAFPVIGRGNILRDSLAGTEDIDRDIHKILG
jgi:hypothetical protein